MRIRKSWIAGGLVVTAAALGFALPQSRARIVIRNEGVSAIHGTISMDRSSWAFFVPLHELRDLTLPPGAAHVEIDGDPGQLVRDVILVGGETTTIEYHGER